MTPPLVATRMPSPDVIPSINHGKALEQVQVITSLAYHYLGSVHSALKEFKYTPNDRLLSTEKRDLIHFSIRYRGTSECVLTDDILYPDEVGLFTLRVDNLFSEVPAARAVTGVAELALHRYLALLEQSREAPVRCPALEIGTEHYMLLSANERVYRDVQVLISAVSIAKTESQETLSAGLMMMCGGVPVAYHTDILFCCEM